MNQGVQDDNSPRQQLHNQSINKGLNQLSQQGSAEELQNTIIDSDKIRRSSQSQEEDVEVKRTSSIHNIRKVCDSFNEKKERKRSQTKSFEIHDINLQPFKNQISNGVIFLSFATFSLIAAGLFSEPIEVAETNLLIRVQQQLGLSEVNEEGETVKNSHLLFFVIANIQEHTIAVMLVSHIFAGLYFNLRQKLAIKLIIIQFTSWFFLVILQLMYASPQPYWIDHRIVTYLCDQKYDTPNDSSFLTLTFFCNLIYQLHREWKEFSDYNERKYDQKANLLYLSVMVFTIVYGMMVYISGQCFLRDIYLSIVYFTIQFTITVLLTPSLDSLVNTFTENYVDNKHYIFYVLGIVGALEVAALVFFYSEGSYENMVWIQNFYVCFTKASNFDRGFFGIQQYSYRNILGVYQTFSQCSILFCIVGLVFSGFPISWRKLSLKNNIILHLSFFPFWIWALFQTSILNIPFFQTIIVNLVIVQSIFCLTLYIWTYKYVGHYIIKNASSAQTEEYVLMEE